MMAPPQTPRHGRKLTLDINSSFSNVGSPATPSSPVASLFSASPKQFEGSVPPSPTMSGSWNVSKSPAELTALLKEAYGVIRERERDLLLAAEIGKSLLENNIALKSKYESEIVQLQNMQRSRVKPGIFSIQHTQQHTQLAPPSTALETFSEEPMEFDESDTESLYGISSSYEPSSGESLLKRKNHQLSNSGLNYKDLENLRELETRNQDLQQKLEEALKEHSESEKANRTKIRKLETDFQHVQESCVLATQKIEELEKVNDHLVQKQKADFWNLKYNKKTNENDDYIEALLHKVQELEDQNTIIEKAKVEIERRLKRTTDELVIIKGQYDDSLEKLENYEYLQHVNRDQEKLIAELNENLEEQRALVVSYRNRGVWSQKTSRANSISDGGNIMSNALRRLSDPDGMRFMFGGVPQKPQKTSLLSEFETEWFRELQREVKRGNDYNESPAFSPSSSVGDLHDYFLTAGARQDDDMEYLSDDDFSFLDEFDVDNEKANRLREWFWQRWIRAVYRFLRKIWRWCRFIVILIAAVLMALYRGPDDILPNEM